MCPTAIVRSLVVTVLLAPWNWLGAAPTNPATPEGDPFRPNVLFIALDDLNDWTGCLGGHPQALTPNLDRLASSGMLFTNAHCPAPACNPSRTAIFTGRSPHRSGLYDNRQKMREVLPDAEIIPKALSRHGYRSAGSGKMLHYFIDAPSWDEYFPEKESENPFPRTLYPETRPLSLPRAGPWQYVETDWGPLEATDEEYGGDHLVARWISEQLTREQERPFFLACGIYRPHEPWFVPEKYFEPFPLVSIGLPPGTGKTTSRTCRRRARSWGRIATSPTSASKVSGSRGSRVTSRRSTSRTRCSAASSTRSNRDPTPRTRSSFSGRITAGTSERSSTGKSTPPGAPARASR